MRHENEIGLLQMALIGYQQQADEISAKIEELQRALSGNRTARVSATPRKKRTLSPAARKRIAAAQKKRWAKHRAEQKAASAAASGE